VFDTGLLIGAVKNALTRPYYACRTTLRNSVTGSSSKPYFQTPAGHRLSIQRPRCASWDRL